MIIESLDDIQVQLDNIRQLTRIISDYREDLSGLPKQDMPYEFLAIKDQQASVESAIDTIADCISNGVTKLMEQERRALRDSKKQ